LFEYRIKGQPGANCWKIAILGENSLKIGNLTKSKVKNSKREKNEKWENKRK